ncbi:tyrosine--tRNA ligase [Gluconacetobacter entanii]|uniref:Tyrosine--tRNA ligase n=1 Tax=Gluconacetobacter entanii TaxID=108528 RepID=A0A318PW63_9PROT|nr:tyrosine--tRNA ligase [Gluconacetobacter entanii]MBE7620314.1 tyrosine--tRNA ligase [Komagataeibacter sp. FXV2]MCE2579665.1 tyrosine--tRNA ligase [Komagataeibacter sp. FNDCR1]MCW4591732.1 tyrosine--tRNA ligase [Gluconacetobacter entanii]MCW4593573.1 tyrosine--tRNA ligase [Gluconacetobacter entanii]NPC88034.1 tyrosine--tRNA ligase [Gluconacetobacter entanii]
MPKSEFLREAEARGFIFQCTDMEALDAAMQAGPVSGYIGFDPTADSLHVGSLIQIMMLRLMQKHGHRPVALMGGGTAKIGDPSFREEARKLMTAETIAQNLRGIEGCLRQFLSFDDKAENRSGAMLANNADWLDRLSYIDLLRDVGIHFSVNRMLSFDSVRSRLEREQGLTFLEFNYSILQSYDFRELNARHGVTLQMGGSDQWGNIVSGIDLVRRMNQQQVFGLTTPLLTTSSGAKMGKSARGAVWLSAARLPVFEYWQFWRNTEDADVGRFLRLFTDLPIEECDRLAALPGAGINEAKKVLATEATALCHGRAAAEQAAEAARRTFEEGALSADALPSISIAAATLHEGIPAFRLFADSGLVASNGEARRLIRGGGARLNDEVVTDEGRMIGEGDLRDGVIKLSSGKKKHILVRPA